VVQSPREHDMCVQTVPAGDERREAHPYLQCDAGRLRQHRHGTVPADLRQDSVERLAYRGFRPHEVPVEIPQRPARVRLVTVGERTSAVLTHPQRLGHDDQANPPSGGIEQSRKTPVLTGPRAAPLSCATARSRGDRVGAVRAALGLAWAVTEAERNKLAVVAQRHHDAVVVHGRVVQDLVAAKWAIEAGHPERGLEIVTNALTEAQDVVSQLRRDEQTGPDGWPGRRH